MVGMILFIIGILITIGLAGYILKVNIDFVKTPIAIDHASFIKKNAIFTAVFSVFFTLTMFSIYLWAKITPTTRDILSTLFGGLFFSFFGLSSLQLFVLHYYGKGIPENLDKYLFRGLCVFFPLIFVFVFLLSDGFADYMNLNQPLVNGIKFIDGFAWGRPGSYGERPNVAFYAICILSGAIYVYFICDHKMFLQYGEHGILESTFLVSLPAGIIGARIWYVIGNWELKFAHAENPFLAAIDMTEGGLTILGGAIMGIFVGVVWVKIIWRNKPYKLSTTADIVVPTILIAQAVGRWGNFFNCEVHGFVMDEAYWRWLPKIIFNNAHFSSSYPSPLVGQVYVPLFFIECITNLLGFFVIAHLFGIKFKKYLNESDLAFMYVTWYGMTRVLMEPLRDADFNMGTDGYWSWTWSMIFVVSGILLIVINHVIRFISARKKNVLVEKDTFKRGIISGSSFLVCSLPFIIIGSVLMATNEFAQKLVFNEFNIGLILLVTGVSILLLAVISALDIYQGIIYRKESANG